MMHWRVRKNAFDHVLPQERLGKIQVGQAATRQPRHPVLLGHAHFLDLRHIIQFGWKPAPGRSRENVQNDDGAWLALQHQAAQAKGRIVRMRRDDHRLELRREILLFGKGRTTAAETRFRRIRAAASPPRQCAGRYPSTCACHCKAAAPPLPAGAVAGQLAKTFEFPDRRPGDAAGAMDTDWPA